MVCCCHCCGRLKISYYSDYRRPRATSVPWEDCPLSPDTTSSGKGTATPTSGITSLPPAPAKPGKGAAPLPASCSHLLHIMSFWCCSASAPPLLRQLFRNQVFILSLEVKGLVWLYRGVLACFLGGFLSLSRPTFSPSGLPFCQGL